DMISTKEHLLCPQGGVTGHICGPKQSERRLSGHTTHPTPHALLPPRRRWETSTCVQLRAPSPYCCCNEARTDTGPGSARATDDALQALYGHVPSDAVLAKPFALEAGGTPRSRLRRPTASASAWSSSTPQCMAAGSTWPRSRSASSSAGGS